MWTLNLENIYHFNSNLKWKFLDVIIYWQCHLKRQAIDFFKLEHIFVYISRTNVQCKYINFKLFVFFFFSFLPPKVFENIPFLHLFQLNDMISAEFWYLLFSNTKKILFIQVKVFKSYIHWKMITSENVVLETQTIFCFVILIEII